MKESVLRNVELRFGSLNGLLDSTSKHTHSLFVVLTHALQTQKEDEVDFQEEVVEVCGCLLVPLGRYPTTPLLLSAEHGVGMRPYGHNAAVLACFVQKMPNTIDESRPDLSFLKSTHVCLASETGSTGMKIPSHKY